MPEPSCDHRDIDAGLEEFHCGGADLCGGETDLADAAECPTKEGNMALWKRAGIYNLDITAPDGTRIRRSTGTTDREKAKEYAHMSMKHLQPYADQLIFRLEGHVPAEPQKSAKANDTKSPTFSGETPALCGELMS